MHPRRSARLRQVLRSDGPPSYRHPGTSLLTGNAPDRKVCECSYPWLTDVIR